MDIAKKEKKIIEQENKQKTVPLSIKWEGSEYEHIPKSNNWYWSVVIISLGIIFASILLKNFLFAILVVIAGIAVILFGARKPKKVSFSLTPKGLQIDKRLFPFENLRSFWLHYDPPHKKILTIEPKRFLMPVISVPIEDIDPNQIRQYLLKFLKEERQEESLITTITRLIGF